MTQNDEQFCLPCLSHLIFQESCIIWSSFMRHMCKRKIYSGIFFIFSKFWFSCPKWQKILSVSLHIAGTIHHMIMIHSKMMISPAIFFVVFFFNSDFSGGFFGGEGGKGKKLPIITNLSLSHSMSQELWIISSRFLVHICKIMISPSVLLFFLKYNLQPCFFYDTVFLINSCFSSSSINAKQKFRGVPHLPHLLLIFW